MKVIKVLVVEDIGINRAQLKAVLGEESYELIEAKNGLEAVQLFQKVGPDLVLMDIHMPLMDGYEAARQIKSSQGESYVPIIFISAEDDEKVITQALDAGGDDFISRPFNPSLLQAKINAQLRIQALNGSLQNNIQQLEWAISDHKKTQRELYEITNYDILTDLPNRQFFLVYLAQMVKEASLRGQQMALLIMDVANFKRINDVYGHLLGDFILKEVTARLQHSVAKERLIARVGGDHFAVLCDEYDDIEFVEQVVAGVIDAVKAPYELSGDEVILGLNVGISLFPRHCDSAESMLRCAGTALEYARQQGDNSYSFFELEMKDQVQFDLELNSSIYTALQNNEFELYYQSQVDSINKQIVGCEVLLRWHHPTLGAIPPDRFIPLLEQNGLIRMVGEWVMQQAIEQHLEWLRKGFPGVRIAVNFSAIQLQEETLAEWFIDVIRKSGISPPWFKLEITETTTIDNLDQAARSLQKIRSAGIQIAVDDFGTGYSTLNYLQRLPVDIIKIDQQFIKEIPSSKDDMTLVKAVIAMAHSMGFDVVAEGVETKVQADFLREHQCEELQGFYFSKPVPANEFEQLLITQGKVGAGSLEMF
ncbi:MAG: EAL domain-containing protein [Gammaproteobacteria bacterium]|jgi:diguanylate cyclase (GGDEF)-like protein|nr:EAL domain-containing protein [Gammaproteobacteria bacterium]MBT3490219.1 EAL domain-containing protein [Gammaproteobacteria bacterium]MBT3719812.1 EAL domain-containing protein [Gammaproteobacteria bacterium]MBT3845660.1 EAL domain-containing protein [Gammaproteobacteria bacterium]MBT3893099.1 EAL domain-containing protein [Gammaproteobacteria bacterium]